MLISTPGRAWRRPSMKVSSMCSGYLQVWVWTSTITAIPPEGSVLLGQQPGAVFGDAQLLRELLGFPEHHGKMALVQAEGSPVQRACHREGRNPAAGTVHDRRADAADPSMLLLGLEGIAFPAHLLHDGED